MGALLIALPLAASAQVAIFSDDFTGSNGDPLGSDWNQGNASNVEIQNNAADPQNGNIHVFGVDPSVAGILDPNDFSISVDFTVQGPAFAGIWFQGRSDTASNNQVDNSGYAVRFRPDNGKFQTVNVTGQQSASLGGWDSATRDQTLNTNLYNPNTDTFRLTVSSSANADDIDVLFENISTSTTLATFTGSRGNRNTNADAGTVFGLYATSGTSSITFDNYSVVPEPTTLGLLLGGGGLLLVARHRRAKAQK